MLRRDVEPTFVGTAATLLHRRSAIPERARLHQWITEEDGVVIGYAGAELPWDTSQEGVGEFHVVVAPLARRRGVGGALYDRAIGHLRSAGARTAGSWAQPDGIGFLERRGHERRRSSRQSALDLREADLTQLPSLEEEKAREGFEVVPLGDVFDRPQDLYQLDVATSADEPSDYPIDAMAYDEWLRTTYEHPGIDRDLSRVVLAGRPLVAWALIGTDGAGRGVNNFTGTRPEYRGRGLGRLVKLAAAQAAREAGVEVLYTGNDATNAPMLAINERMGYRPIAKLHYLVRTL